MKEPELVNECLSSMSEATKLPITAKTRIGFDDTENIDYLNNFVSKIKSANVKKIILHARKAILKGLSPKDTDLWTK